MASGHAANSRCPHNHQIPAFAGHQVELHDHHVATPAPDRPLMDDPAAVELERDLAGAPADGELAAATGLSVDDVAEALVARRARRAATSFDAPVGLGDGLAMYDAIPDDAAQAGFAAAESEVFLLALLDTV